MWQVIFFPLYTLPVSGSDWFKDLKTTRIILFGLNNSRWISLSRMPLGLFECSYSSNFSRGDPAVKSCSMEKHV